MTEFVFESQNEADTERLGALLAELLPDRTVVALDGPLGAGKTRLVQAIGRASGVAAGEVISPTFVLIKEYEGRRPISHFDAYRLKDEDEFLELGPEEYFDRPGLALIEWASRVAGVLPREFLQIEIEVLGEQERRFTLHSTAPRLAEVILQVQRRLELG